MLQKHRYLGYSKGGMRHSISMDVKMDIIKSVERGERKSDVARRYGLTPSTVSTITKSKERILAYVKHSGSMSSTVVTRKRLAYWEMEKRLRVWIGNQIQRREPLSLSVIKGKAQSLLDEATEKLSENSEVETTFLNAGWWIRFVERANLSNILNFQCHIVDNEDSNGTSQVSQKILFWSTI